MATQDAQEVTVCGRHVVRIGSGDDCQVCAWQAAQPQWVSVETMVPEKFGMYLACCAATPKNEVSPGRTDIFSAVWEDEVGPGESPHFLDINEMWQVTHWMKLPSPPAGVSGGTR